MPFTLTDLKRHLADCEADFDAFSKGGNTALALVRFGDACWLLCQIEKLQAMDDATPLFAEGLH